MGQSSQPEEVQIIDVAIIGGGITGLTTAWSLQNQQVNYMLFERYSIPGGYIRTHQAGSYLIELGPNSYLLDQEVLDWIGSLGLEAELLKANAVSKARYIWKNGQYKALPGGPISLLASSFFSWKTKFKILADLWAKPAPVSPETTVAQFFEERFGPEIVDYAVKPFVSGIYAGRADQLLVWQTFPSLAAIAQNEGSLIKGFAKMAKKGRRQSVTFKNGMSVLPKTIAKQLSHIRLNAEIKKVKRVDQLWELKGQINGYRFTIMAHNVVFSIPAFKASQLLKSVHPALSKQLAAINYPPMMVVHTIWKKKDGQKWLNGFGGLHPEAEGRFTLGHIWTSRVFDGRCKPDEVLITCFVGGVGREEDCLLDETLIVERVIAEIKSTYQVEGKPVYISLSKWANAIPQYDLAQKKVAATISKELKGTGLYFQANWLGGISLSDCIQKGLAFRLGQSD